MDNENKERVDQVKTYQIDRAKQYVAEHKSKDGSDDTLEVCIISDLLRQLKLSTDKQAWSLERRINQNEKDLREVVEQRQ